MRDQYRDDCPTAFKLSRRDVVVGGLSIGGTCRVRNAVCCCGADVVVRSIRGAIYGNFAAAGSTSPERGGRKAHGRCDGRVESVAVAAD